MSNPTARTPGATPAGVLGRLTLVAAAWLLAGAVVTVGACTILTPLPLARMLPAPPVIARSPVLTPVLSQVTP